MKNEEKLDSKILLLFDPAHLFKNVYNNWLKKINFQCPTFITDDKKKDMLPYKISEQVLHPQVIEKSSLKMAEAVFHESTINALKYYASHGYNHFNDLASFTKIIRDWFNTLNIKSIAYGVRKRDECRNAVQKGKCNCRSFIHYKIHRVVGILEKRISQLVCYNKHLMQLSVLAKPS